MDFSTIKEIQIPQGKVTQISIGGVVVWKYAEPVECSAFYIQDVSGADNTITFTQGGGTAPIVTLEYSTNGTTWTTLGSTSSSGLTYILPANGKVYLRGLNYTLGNFNNGTIINFSGNANVGGDITTLLNRTGDLFDLSGRDYAFRMLFFENHNLIDASELLLPSTTLADRCYTRLFHNCTSLIAAPLILPATSLTTACYSSMFENTAISESPVLPARTLVQQCYSDMFYNCHSLSKITTYASDISAQDCTQYWVNYVANSGHFYNNGLADFTIGENGIPAGWIEYTPFVTRVQNIQVLTSPIYANTTNIKVSYELVTLGGIVAPRTKKVSIPANTTGVPVDRTVSITDHITFNVPYHQLEIENMDISTNEFWYTSDNGYEVLPSSPYPFTPTTTILSNTYTDKGVIVCDNDITTIEFDAFSNCTHLTSVTISSTVEEIMPGAFSYCSNLSEITCYSAIAPIVSSDTFRNLPTNGRLYVVNGATGYDEWLTYLPSGWSIYIIGQIPNNEIWYTSTDGNIVTPYTVAFGTRITVQENTYAGGKGIIKLSGDATTIGTNVFQGCSSLASIVIPDSVTSIRDSAFYNCSSLTFIDIPDSVTSIGERAFYSCSHLESIEIPDSVTSIGERAFSSCSSLESIEIPDSVTSLDTNAFYECEALETVHIGSGVSSITTSASSFSYCYALSYITVDSNNAYYSDGNGSNCIIDKSSNKLIRGCSHTVIPSNVTSIGNYAFQHCSGLTSINIPNAVTSIGTQAFYRNVGLTSIEFPESVTSIGDKAFQHCDGITSITVNAKTPPTISTNTFGDITTSGVITVPFGTLSAYQSSNWNTYKPSNFVFQEEVVNIVDVENIVVETSPIYADTTKIDAVYDLIDDNGNSYAREMNDIVIPTNTTGVPVDRTVTVTDVITFNIPYHQIETAGPAGPATNEVWYTTSGGAVLSALTATYFKGNNGASLTLTSNTYTGGIGKLVFSGDVYQITGRIAGTTTTQLDKLTSIYLPSTLTSIGSNAFGGMRNITDVYCYAMAAPSTSSSSFGSTTSSGNQIYTGYTTRASGNNKLHLKQGATGYTSTFTSNYWYRSLLTASKCGFSEVYDL